MFGNGETEIGAFAVILVGAVLIVFGIFLPFFVYQCRSYLMLNIAIQKESRDILTAILHKVLQEKGKNVF